MKLDKISTPIGKISCALLLVVSLILSFTVSDYYIFNRISEYGFAFVFCQWLKKAGLLLLPLAFFYNKKCCSDIAKYILIVAVIISSFTFGSFFDITSITEDSTSADLVYAHINEFIPKWANITLFFTSNALYIICCVCLLLRDGFGVKAKSFIYLPLAIIALVPLNIFENFFDIENFSRDSFFWFKNFTVWHLLAIVTLITFTTLSYLFLRHKERRKQEDFLVAMAIIMLIQYHSKDSVVMGDGYNVYHTVFACIPLFICNLGIYVVALSVILKRKVLYAISFFVHAAGAVTVFVYFGKDEMSNYGIFASYSILYFCLTHCLLFATSVLPSALGHYKFKIKDCIIPLLYYFVVIIIASLASGIVSSASMSFSYNGYTLQDGEWLTPNYAFTQINPLPFDVPMVKLTIWKYDLNALYILGLYAVYVAIFFAFNGLYYAFIYIRKKIIEQLDNKKRSAKVAETAITKDEDE
jgi:hypothetical protein